MSVRPHPSRPDNPRRWRGSIMLVGVLAGGLLTGCTRGSSTPAQLTPDGAAVTVGPITISARAGAVGHTAPVTVSSVPAAELAALARTLNDGPAPVRLLGSAHIDVGATLAAPVTMTVSVPKTAKVPLALTTYDKASGGWRLVPATYDPSRGTLTAQVTHFSDWAWLSWLGDRISAVLDGAWQQIFGAVGGASPPSCPDSPMGVVSRDSLLNDAIESCIRAADASTVTLDVVNTRAYPVDLITPADAVVSDLAVASTMRQLGAKLQAAVSGGSGSRHLLPGRGSARVKLSIAPGGTSSLATELDGEAYLFADLDVALQTAAMVYAWLGRYSSADQATSDLLRRLDLSKCMERVHNELTGELSHDDALTLGNVAMECLKTLTADTALGAFAGAISLIVSLGEAVVMSGWVVVDTAMAASRHVITVERGATQPAPAPPGSTVPPPSSSTAPSSAPVPVSPAARAGWSGPIPPCDAPLWHEPDAPPCTDPGAQAVPRGAQRLGGVDLDRYCHHRSLVAALRWPNTWGWRCGSARGAQGSVAGDQDISVDDACAEQYDPDARSSYSNYADPQTWFCWLPA